MIYRIHNNDDEFMFMQFDMDELSKQVDRNIAYAIDATPKQFKDKWESFDVNFINDDAHNDDTKHLNRNKDIPDIYANDGHLFLSQKAKDTLELPLRDRGEFLPMRGQCQWMFNPLRLIEVTTNSVMDELLRLPRHIEFDREELIFRTPFDDYIGIYCNDEFVKLCVDNDLKGIVFDSELHHWTYDNYKNRVKQ